MIRTPRRRAVALAALLVISILASCQVARSGGRCRTTEAARDRSHVLICRNGRWQRAMTLNDAARVLAELVRLSATTTAAPAPPPPTAPAPSTSTAAPTTVTTTVVPPAANLVTNGGLEDVDGDAPTQPRGWNPIRFGTNTATFDHSAAARTGTRSVQVEVVAFSDGGATWAFDPVPVTGSQEYRYTSWSRGSVAAEVLVVERDAQGDQSFQLLGYTDPSDAWVRIDAPFTTAAETVSVTVFTTVAGIGWSQVDDVSLTVHTPRRLTRPLVSLTFDDGYVSDRTVAFPVLEAAGMKATFYLISGWLGAGGRLDDDHVRELHDAGHQIGSHTVNHFDLTTLTPSQLASESTDSRTSLEQIVGSPVVDFASPFGAHDLAVRNELMTTYQSHRTVVGGTNTRDFTDLSRLKGRLVLNTTTVADVQRWIDEAQADGSWLILIFHELQASPGTYGTTPARFAGMIDAVSASGVVVRTVADARAEVAAQL